MAELARQLDENPEQLKARLLELAEGDELKVQWIL
jgi:hypothetical protein